MGWVGADGYHEPEDGSFPCTFPHCPDKLSIEQSYMQSLTLSDTSTRIASRVAVAMDSSYLYDGLQGNPMKWQAQHWVTGQDRWSMWTSNRSY